PREQLGVAGRVGGDLDFGVEAAEVIDEGRGVGVGVGVHPDQPPRPWYFPLRARLAGLLAGLLAGPAVWHDGHGGASLRLDELPSTRRRPGERTWRHICDESRATNTDRVLIRPAR